MKTNNKILIITTSYPIIMNGSEAAGSFVADFARQLNEICDVAVVCPGPGQIFNDNFPVKTYRFWSPQSALSTLNPGNPLHWYPLVKVMISGQKKCNTAVEDFHPDHIFALWVLPSGFWASRASKRYKIRYSTWALGSDIWSLGKIPIIKTILKKVLLGSHRNFADGLKLCMQVEDICNDNCEFLPSTRSIEHIDKTLRTLPPYRLTFLGRWHTNKGVDILLDALEYLEDSDWKLIEAVRIEGGGPLSSLIHKKAEKLAVNGRPVFIGKYLDKNEASLLLNSTDYLVIPSRIESIPVVFSDAMNSQCPIIATPVGDIPHLVEQYECGVISESVNSYALSIAIRQALHASPISFIKGLSSAKSAFNLKNACANFLNGIRRTSE